MKKHPLEILSVLHTILHGKIQIKANSAKLSPDEIAKIINMHPYRVKLEVQKMKNVSLKDLVKLKENISLEKDDLEILEDMIMIAINDAIKKVDNEINDKLGSHAGSLSSFL